MSDQPKLEAAIDASRRIKVIVIGAGISGLSAGAILPQKVEDIELTIYEKNSGVAGVWLENRYPGVRCDVPSHAYQSTFFPNNRWSEIYAPGSEIQQYWEAFAEHFGLHKYIKLNTRVKKAAWIETDAQWHVEVEQKDSEKGSMQTFVDKCKILLIATGHFNDWKFPDIPGLESFAGPIIHTSNWDPNFDPAGKRIALIGNGASGIQILPQLQKSASHVYHYVRSRTWVGKSFGSRVLQGGNRRYTEFEKEAFADPHHQLQYRKTIEEELLRSFSFAARDSPGNLAMEQELLDDMQRRLGKRSVDLWDKIKPNFPVGCRRLTPGPGYLEAIAEDNVLYITDPITHVTETGIITDGEARAVDAIICATGADTSFAPAFPVISGDSNLHVDWRPGGSIGHPETYLGMAVAGFPNLLFIAGPNSTGIGETLNHAVENQITYCARVIRKVAAQQIRTIVPKASAVVAFGQYCERIFPRLTVSAGCRSWYNGGIPNGKIHGLWPGSGFHSKIARKEPRWEDYEYTYEEGDAGIFSYFGDGWTSKELNQTNDLSSYLKIPSDINLKTYFET